MLRPRCLSLVVGEQSVSILNPILNDLAEELLRLIDNGKLNEIIC